MPGQTFTGEALVDALSSGELDHQPGIVLSGMVKPSEQPDHVAFARGGCDTWVDLPTSMIEQAEHVGSRPCEDHSHPVFRITLSESEDPQAKLLGQLLGSQPRWARARRFPGSARPGRASALDGACLRDADSTTRASTPATSWSGSASASAATTSSASA